MFNAVMITLLVVCCLMFIFCIAMIFVIRSEKNKDKKKSDKRYQVIVMDLRDNNKDNEMYRVYKDKKTAHTVAKTISNTQKYKMAFVVSYKKKGGNKNEQMGKKSK